MLCHHNAAETFKQIQAWIKFENFTGVFKGVLILTSELRIRFT